ncbi:MAG: Wzz/FepE/Etk N-terminal domain-containing protein [Desulfobulbaceae bacterium]|nr:Wzz/FepE/Etk N-terminal domain-containing protein [Desulfobulbaceae bacterium]
MPEQHHTTKEKEIVYLQPAFPCDGKEDEIDLLDLWNVLWQGKWLIALVVSVSILAAAGLAFFYLPVTYKSEAVLLETKQDGSALAGLSGLIGNLPIPSDLSGGNQTSILSFLESRTLKERLITKYNLLPILYKDIWDPNNKKWLVDEPEQAPTLVKTLQSKKLDEIFEVISDKTTGLTTISWVDQSPAFCKEMLDRVIAELNFFLDNEYISSARKEREFVEHRLALATKDLEYWERQVPTEQTTLAQITREHLAAQTVYTELRKQLELARISEAKENISFKVLDAPFAPETPFKPKKILIVLLAATGSFFFAVFLVFFLQFVKNLKAREREKTVARGE